MTIVVDDIDPTREVSYEPYKILDAATMLEVDSYKEGDNAILYFKDEAVVTFKINEANFDLSMLDESTKPVIQVNGAPVSVEWTQAGDEWTATHTIVGDGDYVVTMTYTDLSTNEMKAYESCLLAIDSTVPVITPATFDDGEVIQEIDGYKYYKTSQTVALTITEHNFRADDVRLEVTAQDIQGNPVDISSKQYAEYAKNRDNWTHDGDVHTLVLPVFDIDARYTLDVEYDDILDNNAADYVQDKFVIDHKAPTNIKIEYSESIVEKFLESITFGLYQPEVIVTVTAEDITAGVDYFEWTYTKEEGSSAVNAGDFGGTITTEDITYSNDGLTATATFTIPANARGFVSVVATDRSANAAGETDENEVTIVVDDIDPEITVEYAADSADTKVQYVDGTQATADNFQQATNAYFNGNVTANITINEANFFEGVPMVDARTNLPEIGHNVGIKLSVTDDNGVETVYEYLPEGATQLYADAIPVFFAWATNGDEHTFSIPYAENADYVLTVEYVDFSTNEAGITANDGVVATKTYQSKTVTVDKVAPVVSVDYSKDIVHTIDGRDYYDEVQSVLITVEEHNFRADDFAAMVVARNLVGEDVDVEDFAKTLSNDANWSRNGNTNTIVIHYAVDANYTFDCTYQDLALNAAAEYAEDLFTVDTTAPKNLTVTYSASVVDKILESISFGFYDAQMTVTISAQDDTSGVYYFVYSYLKSEGVSNVNAQLIDDLIKEASGRITRDGNTFTTSFTIPKEQLEKLTQFSGTVEFAAYDRAENSTELVDDKHIVVDNIAPEISVEYVADSADTKVQYVDGTQVTVDNFQKATNAYFNGNVTANITINEANFFEGVVETTALDEMTVVNEIVHNVGIKLSVTDDNGVETVYEYLPEGATQLYADAIPVFFAWATNGDEHTFSIPYAENADYVLTVEYVDFSTNEAGITANDGVVATKTYQSKTVTVDKVAPVVSVDYSNKNVVHTIDGRDYFDAQQSATITVVEHNFRADDFAATVVAQNVEGEVVTVEDFAKTLSNDANWTQNGNTYTITIHYAVDANYTFDYAYQDLALNAAAEYAEDLFTVDTTAPKNLKVTYSASVVDKILESISFGFYDAQMTVTISAQDDTSGVYYFVYSYLKSEGVSNVNAQLIDDLIKEASGRITRDGNTFTTSFTIPKKALTPNTQFNGTVEFTAYDRAENHTEMVDDQRVVVDNIAPVVDITYNKEVQKYNDISYYAGNIDATIVVNEANFYKQDAIVKVNGQAVAVNWVDNSVDVHTGTFTLTEDGDYVVTMEYKDRSGNVMKDPAGNVMALYTSNQLTIDTRRPAVSLSGVKNQSANKDEKYTFTITANDINLDASSFTPVLTAVIRKENGDYVSGKAISLGNMKTVEAGKTYSFTVDNLPEDGVYTFTCQVQDMSGNAYSMIRLDDGKEYAEVRFSINRNGSTFAVDKNTAALLEQYFVYQVDEDVVIEEINVDPIEDYVVKLNGEELVEGEDYTSTLSNKAGEWSKRTYTIAKELFEAEGEYSLVVESTDKTDTTAYSDVKDLNVSFVVDQTPPVITISGLETDGRYQVNEQVVTIIPTDDGGRLNSLKVVVLNSDGQPLKDAAGKDISVRFDLSGEELLSYLAENDGKVTFTVPEGLENQVKILCNDCSVNAEGQTNECVVPFTNVTVSQSGWIIFYANKPLFYGSIAGVVLLLGGIIFFVLFKKRKKEKQADQ